MRKITQTIQPTDAGILDQILAALRESHTFCLSGHQNPDGDVIGSQIAMASLIRRLGKDKKVDIMNFGPVPKSIAFLDGAAEIRNVERVEGKYDILIVFECGGIDRTGNIIDPKSQVVRTINIDHHLHNPNFGDINFVEPTTSSTAELIYKIIERSGLPLEVHEAAALFTGVTTDTGWFRYSNTNVQTLSIASKLLATGLPIADLSERIYLSKSETALRILADVLKRMTLHFDKRLAVLTIPSDVYQSLGAQPDDVEEIVNAGLQIDGIQASILLKEKAGTGVTKASIRSKGDLDINQVARAFGGGGHKNASGCAIPGNLEAATAAAIAQFKKIF
jgi:phosphoesterase RecJ-like protein